MPRFNLNVIIAAALISIFCYHKAARNRYAVTFAEALNLIEDEYVRDVDQRRLFDAAMGGMMTELDQYSAYINPTQYDQFKVGIDQHFGGIGVEVMLDEETQRLMISSPLMGTPAYEAGAMAGDLIMAIDGESTEGWRLEDAVGVMRGEPGSEVVVTVLHKGEDEPVDLHITRAVIEIESILGDHRKPNGDWVFTLHEDPRVGYVRLTTFGEKTGEELEKVIRANRDSIDGFVLDLRGNPGGLLTTAVLVSDMFVDSGSIVSIRGRDGVPLQDFTASSRNTIVPREMPVVVLVDSGSASASEIVAACLQDHARAVIVGDRTWGKGSVQNLIEMEGRSSALKLTTATYWRPSGRDIHRPPNVKQDSEGGDWGVQPHADYAVKMTKEEITEYVKWRRQQDVLRRGDVPPEDFLNQPRPDPQLHKAVEYLQQQFRISGE